MTSADERGVGPRAQSPADDEVGRYAAAVRAEIADLTADQSAELLEDLEDHLREVAAEDSGDLESRLGTPVAYARELRASAGLPPRAVNGSGAGAGFAMPGMSLDDLVRRAERTASRTAAGRAVVEFLPSLQPAWWVLRGWLVVVLMQFMFSDPWSRAYPIPSIGNSSFLGFFFLLVAIPGSVWLARKAPFTGGRRQVVILGNAVLAVVALAAAGNMQGHHGGSYYAAPGPQQYFNNAGAASGLTDDGRSVTNLFVYDSSGKLVDGALVYDQAGNPVTAEVFDDSLQFQPWQDAQGFPVLNRYPQHQTRPSTGMDGAQRQIPVPWIIVQPPLGIHAVAPSQSPGELNGKIPAGGPSQSPSASLPTGPSESPSESPGAPVARSGTAPAQAPSATSAPPNPQPSPATTG